MNLKLQAGQTFESDLGYEHGDYVTVIKGLRMRTFEKQMRVDVGIYKSLTDYTEGARQEAGKSYNVQEDTYDTVVAAIESKIQNSKTLEQALYELLLTRPIWANWELNL